MHLHDDLIRKIIRTYGLGLRIAVRDWGLRIRASGLGLRTRVKGCELILQALQQKIIFGCTA